MGLQHSACSANMVGTCAAWAYRTLCPSSSTDMSCLLQLLLFWTETRHIKADRMQCGSQHTPEMSAVPFDRRGQSHDKSAIQGGVSFLAIEYHYLAAWRAARQPH